MHDNIAKIEVTDHTLVPFMIRGTQKLTSFEKKIVNSLLVNLLNQSIAPKVSQETLGADFNHG